MPQYTRLARHGFHGNDPNMSIGSNIDASYPASCTSGSSSCASSHHTLPHFTPSSSIDPLSIPKLRPDPFPCQFLAFTLHVGSSGPLDVTGRAGSHKKQEYRRQRPDAGTSAGDLAAKQSDSSQAGRQTVPTHKNRERTKYLLNNLPV